MNDLFNSEPSEASIVRVIDFETTGLPDDENAEIIEWGYVDLNISSLELATPGAQGLVKPRRPVTPKTMAIHHITNEDLVDAPPLAFAEKALNAGLGANDLFCAHNIKMEKHFFAGGEHRWICTYKCALTIWPDLESHSNQACRYGLNIDLDKSLAEPPHRALPDAYVTAHILRECLKHRTLDELVSITSRPILLQKIGFGKHRGKTFEELASSEGGYLKWMLGQNFDEDTTFTVKHWLGVK